MGIRRKAFNRPAVDDPYVDAQWIAQKLSCSYRTGLRMIDKLTGEDRDLLDRRFKKETRPKRLRRVLRSVFEARVDELINH